MRLPRINGFIYVLQGYPVLRTNAVDTPLAPGMCAGFKAGSGDAHQLLNLTDEIVIYLEIGDRSPGDSVSRKSLSGQTCDEMLCKTPLNCEGLHLILAAIASAPV